MRSWSDCSAPAEGEESAARALNRFKMLRGFIPSLFGGPHAPSTDVGKKYASTIGAFAQPQASRHARTAHPWKPPHPTAALGRHHRSFLTN